MKYGRPYPEGCNWNEEESMKKKYDVWSEGCNCSGNKSGAIFNGVFEGQTFRDAVIAYFDTLNDDLQSYCDRERLTFWACRFFDNEVEARKSFG